MHSPRRRHTTSIAASLLLSLAVVLLLSSSSVAFRLPLRRLATPLLQQQPRTSSHQHRATSVLPVRPRQQRQRLHAGLDGVVPEQLMIPPPEKVLAAVEKAGGRVTVQDVATLAGVDLFTAQKGLVKLAALVEGDLEVGTDGDLVYQFPRNFRTALRTRSVSQQAKEVWAKIWPSLFYVTRVSFGLCLVLSIVLVFATITFAGSASQGDRDDDRRRDRGFGGGGMSMYFGPSPFDFFYYRPYGYYYSTGRGGGRGMLQDQDGQPEMGFLESCFSYIFGDGDPNAGMEEARYQQIAAIIRRSGGAVVAEQLAPYLDVPAPKDPTGYAMSGSGPLTTVVDESFVLPVLTRLNGRPEVTADGNIVYVFPELMTSAVEGGKGLFGGDGGDVNAKWARQERADEEVRQYQGLTAFKLREVLQSKRIPADDCYDKTSLLERLKGYLLSAPSSAQAVGDAPYLEEQPIPFSVAPATNRVFAGILGVANLGGALVLGGVLRDYATMYGASTPLPGILGLSQALYPALVVYAVGFNVIPFVRSLWVKEKNKEIAARNAAREQWVGILGRAIGPLYEKILAAKNYRSALKVVKKDDVTYSSATSAQDVARAQELRDLEAFDKQVLSTKKEGSTFL